MKREEGTQMRGWPLSYLNGFKQNLEKIRIYERPEGIKFGKPDKAGYLNVFILEEGNRVRSIKFVKFSDHFEIKGSKIVVKCSQKLSEA